MATLSHVEARRLYSWWWDSRISPKNSKWLKENLTALSLLQIKDMNAKVKAMIKLIEEDADSFRNRVEMYYRKCPELMKLVEEFYRAYQALAERYDQATGALRQAHKTMSEAFLDRLPLPLNDDYMHVVFNDMQSNGVHHEVNGTKYGEELKSSNLQNGKESEEFLRLVEENKNIKNQILVELERADKAEVEVQNLKSVILNLNLRNKSCRLDILYQNVPPALLVRFRREHRSEWADYGVDAYSSASVRYGPFPVLRVGASNGLYTGQVILLLSHTVENEEALDFRREHG